MPRFLAHGLDLANVPKMMRPMVQGYMQPDFYRGALPAAMMTHPTENRTLTPEEARPFFAELTKAFLWAFSAMPGGFTLADVYPDLFIVQQEVSTPLDNDSDPADRLAEAEHQA